MLTISVFLDDTVEAEEDAAASNPSRRVVDEQTDVLNDDEVVQQF